MLTLTSTVDKTYVLEINQRQAFLRIDGHTHHLNIPFLQITYHDGEELAQRKACFYNVEGHVIGWFVEEYSTQKLLKVLKKLGFSMDSNTLRNYITFENAI